MGIKMTEAYNTYTKSRIIIKNAETSMNKDLKCITEICKARVSFVSGHYRRGKWIQSFFRLKDGQIHHPDCRFNTVGRVNAIARDSESEVLESIGNDRFHFRLHIIHGALEETKSLIDSNPSPNNGADENNHVDLNYANKGKLDSYLLTMKQIMLLRSEVERNSDLSNIITLQFGDENILWKNFYFEKDDYDRCYSYLKNQNNPHPICISGVIYELKPPTEKYKNYSLQLKWGGINKNNGGVPIIPTVSLTVYKEKVINYLNSSDKKNVLIYANFKANTPINVTKNGKEVQYLNIKGRLVHLNQIILY